MNYIRLISSGDFVDTWVYFYMHPSKQKMTLRDRYATLACGKCGKFDEYEALRLGVDDDVQARSTKDFVETADEAILVSARFRSAVEAEAIGGLDFVPLSGGKYFVVRPTTIVPVDRATCGVKFIGEPCVECGRYRESIYSPRLASMTLPSDPHMAFSPSMRKEMHNCRFAEVFLSADVADRLKQHNLRGIDWRASAKVR